MAAKDTELIREENLRQIEEHMKQIQLLARACGLHICSMGERILRCETAPVVALTAAMYATGNLS